MKLAEQWISSDVRAAIHVFLNECQTMGQPFAADQAMDAIRRIFPDLEISDLVLMDVLTSEASYAGCGKSAVEVVSISDAQASVVRSTDHTVQTRR